VREIKFRAWNKSIKQMGSALPLRTWTDDIAVSPRKYWNDIDNIILMQYTGLKDKNGKEIYEGDIISIIGFKSRDKSQIGFITNGIDVVKYGWYNKDTGFFLVSKNKIKKYDNSIGHCIDHINEKYSEDFEVIGNIYENKELLR
jgi:uncharacterized phage protein (TIGR01671 family)